MKQQSKSLGQVVAEIITGGFVTNPIEVKPSTIDSVRYFDYVIQEQIRYERLDRIPKILQKKFDMLMGKSGAICQSIHLFEELEKTDHGLYKEAIKERDYLFAQLQDVLLKMKKPAAYRSWKFY